MATSYPKTQIIDKSIFKIINDFVIHVEKNSLYDIVSCYLIGSSAEVLTGQSEHKFNDIDLAIIVSQEIKRGQKLIPVCEIENLTTHLRKKHKINIALSFNGIPIIQQGFPHFDIIPISINDVESNYPQVILDICNHNNIHLFGENILLNMMNQEFSPDMIINRILLTEKYLEREYDNIQNSEFRINYLLDCFYYSIELAFGLKTRINRNESLKTFLSDNSLNELIPFYLNAQSTITNNDFKKTLLSLKQYNRKLFNLISISGFLTNS